jgi:methyl-accepting chemotaxis protein
MNSWTLSRRIFSAGLLAIVAMLAIGGVGYLALSQIKTLAVDRLKEDAIPGIAAIADIETLLLDNQVNIVLLVNSDSAEERKIYLERINGAAGKVVAALKVYGDALNNDEDRANYDKLCILRTKYAEVRKACLEDVSTGAFTDAQELLKGSLMSTFNAYRDHAAMMLKWNQNNANKATDEIIDKTVKATLQTSAIGLGLILGALVLGTIIVRSINRILRSTSTTLDESASQVSSAANQVSSSSQTLAHGASEQAASLEETSSSLEELASMTKRNAENAQNAKQLSGDTRNAAETGNEQMKDMRRAMDQIKSSSNDIANIIKSIDEIAFQTNILALNAAVEAARAGEAGAGFAVVAEEVRALAQRSATAAKETAAKIEVAIQNGNEGVTISDKVAQSLDQITSKARRVDELVGEIAHASSEQSQGISQINSAITEMDKVTQTNAANAEETAAAAEELNSQSQVLRGAVKDLRKLVEGEEMAA